MVMNRKDTFIITFTQTCLSNCLFVTSESGLRLKEDSRYLVSRRELVEVFLKCSYLPPIDHSKE